MDCRNAAVYNIKQKKKHININMENRLLTLACALLVAGGMSAQSWPEAKPEAKPGVRWWWMGSAVTEADLKWSMKEYADAGIGAVEITPIYGVKGNEKNELEFLSTPWMNALRFVEAEGAKDGLIVDMNNGTGWPFGGPYVPLEEAAAKLVCTDVNASGKELRKGVDISVKDAKEKQYAKLTKVMAYSATGNVVDITDFTDINGIVRWKKAPKKEQYRIISLYCSRTRQKVKRAAPGGEGYVIDHFDHDAVAHYLQRFEDAFASSGTPYPHTFFNDSYEVYKANWTPKLLDEFEKRRGYKLQEHLLELLGYKEDKGNKVLADYRETLSDLLLENYVKQWTAWAHKHGVKTRNQAHGSPANLIDIYAAVDIPEIEGFGLSEFGIKGLRVDSGFTRKNDSDVSMLKYSSSAAHITGKTLASSETFTWLTEHFRTSLAQCKPDMDLMFTCGVNNMYFHGTTYSPRNEAWPGWKFYASIDMSPTNSIWRDAPYLMKYIERCQSFLQMGQPDNDFLVMLPVRDMWAERKGEGPGSLLMMFDIHGMAKKAPDFIKSILEIDKEGFDCDYISERYILGTTYKDGMLQTAAGTRYHALIIPGSGNMPDNVKAHIAELKAQGAKVIYGINKQEMAAAAKPELMKCKYGLRAIRRSNPTGHHYFIANLSPNDVDARIPLAVDFKDARWFNPLNGEIYKADITTEGIRMDLRSGESMILQTYNEVLPGDDELRKTDYGVAKQLDGKWSLSFVQSAPHVGKAFSLDSLQTWETLDDDSVRVTMGTGAYTTYVDMTAEEANMNWAIDLGDVRESARVYINDSLVGCAWSVPYVLNCRDLFKKGTNKVCIEVTNLPANRIADLDRKVVNWRKFKDINMAALNYKKGTYAKWAPVKSGLNSVVTLYELK